MNEMTEDHVLAIAGVMGAAGDRMEESAPSLLLVIGINEDGETWGVIGGDINNTATASARAALKKLCAGPELIGCREIAQ